MPLYCMRTVLVRLVYHKTEERESGVAAAVHDGEIHYRRQ